ncbi:hypothetical protein [Klenkia brasiliensis]|uniref:Uncharacterized protein n=1 Tax=Klenkia brasiliensis TaxID=333142 RepID=A0A1G7QM18_9ACTN|nr:hypothetical protein [Klenkia brasiliensis]SDF99601.1 hypothetical protein SAMN05660324_1537 [Klenkia brasiliensis]
MTSLRAARFAVPLLVAAAAVAGCSLSSDNVSCSGNSCTATLSGEGSEASILGTSLVFAGTQDGRATLSVGDAEVSCATGERVSAGPLSLTCTSVGDDSVELTASLG